MSSCNSIIKQGLSQMDCAARPVKGYERRAVLLNREDLDFKNVGISETRSNVITSMGLKAGKTGYEVHQMGASPFTGSSASLETNDFYKAVTKSLVIAALENDRDIFGGFVDPLLNGEFVAVVEHKGKGKDNASAFEVLGFHNGLQLSALEANVYGDQYGGGLFTLTETGAPATRMYLGETYEEGQALFESLLETAV